MKLAFCTTRDLTGALILNAVRRTLPDVTIGVFLADRRRAVDDEVPELAALWQLERDIPVDLLFPMVERADRDITPERLRTFNEIGAEGGVFRFRTPSDWARGMPVADWKPDLVISARFGFLFKEDAIAAMPTTVFNLHPGALPRYAGQYPVLRGMADRRPHLGAVIHRITRDVDAGPVVAECHVPANPRLCHFEQRFAVYQTGLQRACGLARRLMAGRDLPWGGPPALRKGGMLTFPDSDELQRLKVSGIRMIDRSAYDRILNRFSPDGAHLAAENGAETLFDQI